MQIKLVRAKKSDLKLLAQIYLDEFSKTEPDWTLKTAYERVRQGLSRFSELCFTINIGNEKIGFILAEVLHFSRGKFVYLADIAVKSKYQEMGYGTMALEKFAVFAKKKGFKEIYLHTEQKGRAMNFYKKAGFTESGYILLGKKLS